MPVITHPKNYLSHIFLFILLGGAFFLVYLFLKPFLAAIVISSILVSMFYGWYSKLVVRLHGRQSLAAFIMVILIALIIILPVTNFLFYLSQKSLEGFSAMTVWLGAGGWEQTVGKSSWFGKINFIDPSVFNLRQYLISASSQISNFMVSAGTAIIKSTGEFLTALLIMFFTIFFLFRDGKKMLERIMHLTPLANKYDREIFQKFRDVSYSVIVSSFAAAAIQGIVGAIGFMIIGIPAFFVGVTMAFLSLLPYIGSAIIWFPAAIYLLLVGQIWQGVFLLLWGFLAVSLVDNIVRPWLIKGRAEVHPLLVFFSIFGGILTFGFWGMFIGPIVIAIFFTLLHIYEMEYGEILEK
ncbi:MAG: AI-2E family transporter [Patescibacteria group bacterium]|jgi:predicted PurR-regulated permease PerM